MNINFKIGRLGKDPEQIKTGGKTLCKFTIATTEGKDLTEWHNCEAWDKTADLILKYCHKGDLVAVVGRDKTTKHEGKYYHSIVVDRVEFLSSKAEPKANAEPRQATMEESFGGTSSDDLPF